MDSCGCEDTRSGMAEPGQPGTQKIPLLSNSYSVCMETICPICKLQLDAHADTQMADCGLALFQRDHSYSYTRDFEWMCPECDGDVTDHDDAMLAHCSRLLVMGSYCNGVCLE